MPYARQDKVISNETTFALIPFIKFLDILPVDAIKTFDVHNPLPFINGLKNVKFYNETPYRMVQIAENRKPDAIFFPDKGAKARYGNLFRHLKGFHFNMVPHICGEKVRDPLTGNITGYSVGDIGVATSVLVCDDLIDAGGTFVLAAEELIKSGVTKLDLYASHLIQRKAIDRLFDAGYSSVYTKDSLFINDEEKEARRAEEE
jgi:phosphoribosylpyrophosphate synthetase